MVDPEVPVLTKGWRQSFLKRHANELKVATPHRLESVRAKVSGAELTTFFNLVKNTHQEYGFAPEFISNFDETMVQVTKHQQKAVVPASCRDIYVIDDTAPFHMTVGTTIWADGTSTKPLVILPLKIFPPEVDADLAHSFAWSGQESGWITMDSFEQFIEKVFLPDLQRRRRAEGKPDAPALLYVDGHSSRANPKVLRLLREANVTVITFVAHASHLLQPLDRWLFLQFKSHLQQLSSKIRNLSRPEQRLAMLQAVESSMHNSMKPTNILKSFRRAGLWPIDPEQVFHPATDSPPEPRRRRSRKSFNINGIVLTAEEIVAGLEEEKRAIESAKKRAEKKKKPKSHDHNHTTTQVDEEMQPKEP